jgi:hypothetical protein
MTRVDIDWRRQSQRLRFEEVNIQTICRRLGVALWRTTHRLAAAIACQICYFLPWWTPLIFHRFIQKLGPLNPLNGPNRESSLNPWQIHEETRHAGG